MTTGRNAILSLVPANSVVGGSGPASGVGPAAPNEGSKIKCDIVGPIFQHGYVVADAKKTALDWVGKAGIGPFYVFEQPIDSYIYRGRPTPLTMRIAISYWRDIQLELIQQLSPEETFYSQSLTKAPEKLNHYAVLAHDIPAAIRALDAERYVVHSGGTAGDLTFTYLENYLPDGTTLELMSIPKIHFAAFDGMKAACSHWNGERPLRTMADLMSDLNSL